VPVREERNSMLHCRVVEARNVDQLLVDHRAHGPLTVSHRDASGSGIREGHGNAIGDQSQQYGFDHVLGSGDHGVKSMHGIRLQVPEGHALNRNCEDAEVSRPDVILIDLDGTITDSIPGILRCLREALPTLDMQDVSDGELQTWLGPPLRVTLLERYGRSEEDLDRFVQAYRAVYFGGGEYEFTVFPGMDSFLQAAADSDSRLVLATAKPIESATRVLTRAGLIDHFDFVSGTELDLMRQDKPSIIQHGVESVGLSLSDATAVMIGDRKEDVLGAKHHGITSVGVTWGYAAPGELEGADPDHLISHPQQLLDLLPAQR